MKKLLLFFLFGCTTLASLAQIDSAYRPMEYISFVVDKLCSEENKGRGYTDLGVNKAGHFLETEMRSRQILPFMQGEYKQPFEVAANLIKKSYIRVDKHKLKCGYDYLITPSSGSIEGDYRVAHSLDTSKTPLVSIDQKNIKVAVTMDTTSHLLHTEAATIYPERAHVRFRNTLWSELQAAQKISIRYQNETKIHDIYNIGGIIAGKTDSAVFVTAHYDHLGMQGDAVFPGASDNASGTAMMMALGDYFSRHKPYYTLVLIAFAAEETGLLGSQYFTENMNYRTLPIKMVINLDIMGNAEEGVTVVNTVEQLNFLNTLRNINEKDSINLPEIRQRDNTKNSDHYYFTQDGVPAVFIYSNGGQGYYHDVYDTPKNLLYTNIDKVFYLLTNYITKPQ